MILELRDVYNSSGFDYTNDKVVFDDGNNFYYTTMIAEGEGTVTVTGKVFVVSFSDDIYDDEEGYVQVTWGDDASPGVAGDQIDVFEDCEVVDDENGNCDDLISRIRLVLSV